ncbi:MAG: type II secretion system protein [Chthoniobacteraceae bacterium]
MRRGFTLVEMIVALAVTSVLTVLMLRMFTDSSTIWKREDERLDTFREARAALQLMARELATVNPIPIPDVDPATNKSLQFPLLALTYHGDTPEVEKTTPGNQEIYALATLPYQPKLDPKTSAVRDKSELRAIGYYCEWREEKSSLGEAKNCYVLRRQCADSDTTFSRLQTVLKASGPMQYPASFNILYRRITDLGSSVDLQDIATYVWDLHFTVPAAKTSATPPLWPQGMAARELPEWVEIGFKALGSNAARKLDGQNLSRTDWFTTNSTAYQRFILPAEQQFVTRVKLNR